MMLEHKSAALTLDTRADLFPDDLEAVVDTLDAAVRTLRESTADGCRFRLLNATRPDPVPAGQRSSYCSRGGGIRTHGLFVPNEARYQAAPHPA